MLMLFLQHEQNSSAKTGVGTPIYMAPEIIYGGNRYDAKASPEVCHACHRAISKLPAAVCCVVSMKLRHFHPDFPIVLSHCPGHRKRTSGRVASFCMPCSTAATPSATKSPTTSAKSSQPPTTCHQTCRYTRSQGGPVQCCQYAPAADVPSHPAASPLPTSPRACSANVALHTTFQSSSTCLDHQACFCGAGVSRVQGPADAAAGGRQRAAPQHGGHQEPLLVHARAAQRRHPDERLVHARGEWHQRGTRIRRLFANVCAEQLTAQNAPTACACSVRTGQGD